MRCVKARQTGKKAHPLPRTARKRKRGKAKMPPPMPEKTGKVQKRRQTRKGRRLPMKTSSPATTAPSSASGGAARTRTDPIPEFSAACPLPFFPQRVFCAHGAADKAAQIKTKRIRGKTDEEKRKLRDRRSRSFCSVLRRTARWSEEKKLISWRTAARGGLSSSRISFFPLRGDHG